MTLETAIRDYQAKTPRSRQLFEDALRVMPGGNSRTTTFFDPYPFYIARGAGARIWDADGNERLDFNGNYTSLILGHANPTVVQAIQDAAVHGMSFPGPSEHEIRLAEILTRRIPTMEVIRFANSGTEATMHAIRVARAFTGKSKIAKFEGAYHGTHDWVLVSVSTEEGQGGSRKRPKSVAWSAGVPAAVMKHVVVLPWNDLDACVKILEKEAGDLAALIIDPMLANAGMIPVAEGFLEGLRAATAKLGILLIFDEVISFRVATGGAQARFGIRPDLTTLGKIIGGGLAVGAFGGRAEVMNYYGSTTAAPSTRIPSPWRAAWPPWNSSRRRRTRGSTSSAIGCARGSRRRCGRSSIPARSRARARSSGCTTPRSGSPTTARSGRPTPPRPWRPSWP